MATSEPVPPRPGRPRRYGEVEERQRLLDAGFELIRRKGYSEATVAEILAEAGVSTRSFYRHFTSKEELLSALFERDAEQFSAAVARRVEAADGHWEGIVTWIDEILAFGLPRGRTRRAAVLGAPAVRSALPPRQMRSAIELLLVPLEALVRAGSDQGQFLTDDPVATSDLLSAMTWETSARIGEAKTGLERDALRTSLITFVARGLGHSRAT